MYDTSDMKVLLSLLFIVFSIIGMADSGYITYEKFAGLVPECAVGFDCGAVLNSEWATIGPVPLSLLGFIFYSTVFILGVLQFIEFDIRPFRNRLCDLLNLRKNHTFRVVSLHELLLIITTFGFLFSLYLIYIMAFLIGEWCQFCLISAGTSTLLFITSIYYFSSVKPNSPFLFKKILFSLINFVYKTILKPLFFQFDAETVHNTMTKVGKMLGSNPFTKTATALKFSFKHSANQVTLDGITYQNRVGLCAGFDYNGELTGILPQVGFGFHTIGTVTFNSYEGNPKPRLGRFPNSKSLLVNKGLKSLGAVAIAQKLSGITFEIPTGISIASTNKLFNSEKEQITDILSTFTIFENSSVKHAYYELNISCPNTFGGEPFTTPKRLTVLLTALEKLKLTRPVYIKMPIDQNKKETLELLKVIDQFTIAGVIFGNLTKDKNNPDVTPEDKKVWQKSKGNLSGKPTWKRSNELIELTKRNFGSRFTIIGTGGIFSGTDAQVKIDLGADLIQLITGMIFTGPQVIGEINLELAKNKISNK